MRERRNFMNKKRIISTICIFLLCCLTHFIYNWFPFPVFAIFFPVNESIWEHMKLIYTTILLFEGFRLYMNHYKNQETHFFTAWICACLSIPIYLIFYLPLYNTIGHNMIISLVLLFVTIWIEQWIQEKIKRRENEIVFYITIIGIVLSYIGLGILTYHPPFIDLFYDPKSQIYGLNYYVLSVGFFK